jgi:hypothetical protein
MEFDHFAYENGDVDVFCKVNRRWKPWVMVRPSVALMGIAEGERGLFAARDMPTGTVIGRYVGHVLGLEGDRVVERKINRMEKGPEGRYILNVEGVYVDGNCPLQSDLQQLQRTGRVIFPNESWTWPGALVHLANDARNAPYVNNMAILPDGMAVTSCHVPGFAPGNEGESEFLWCYGDPYWEMVADQEAAQKKKRQEAERRERAAKRS